MRKITHEGKTYDFNEIRDQMDPDVIGSMETDFDSDQDFFTTYLVKHHEKFGERFVIR